ncbi:tRNA pseudouridine synthase B [Lachnospiraceae bacterium]|uniref:tRNA pseudouridine(55) synthase TruB n=1 Tax=Extibacter sp. GGCC_0201 TaxID=2731209 RepID=UPI001AA1D0F2|nr:tRNA pseudouridine(55) synthase TruB [Extibacter sp. GGCC_0201]MBO1719209.1 tRNA pseudouridine(55) synthase TruB [Extibacter sp. GGCC_0201]BDF34133.1 tRNA pseudouridine synthase B [Lachnospiraceae bacterium]BDF38137.1 tRNA pseudouridine synthase B [Lachnospiraceae bacterium]
MIHGVINVYKEKGFTSHDVVARLRGILKQKKIGHTGTLDPDAEGVLPVCLGKATRLCDMLTDNDKTYEAVLLLGMETDTQDTSGDIVRKRSTSHLTEEAVQEAVLRFTGEYAQIPPMYSAVKIGGRKLYELAREGKVVERKARKVRIHHISILDMQLPRVKMEIRCSKGTYIRTLCHDIGQSLGCGGCMEQLTRTQVGRFQIDGSIRLSEVEKMKDDGTLSDAIVPVDEMFSDYRKVVADQEQEPLAYNGNAFPGRQASKKADCFEDGENVRVYDREGHFIGVYEYRMAEDKFKVKKMFFDRNSR